MGEGRESEEVKRERNRARETQRERQRDRERERKREYEEGRREGARAAMILAPCIAPPPDCAAAAGLRRRRRADSTRAGPGRAARRFERRCADPLMHPIRVSHIRVMSKSIIRVSKGGAPTR